MIGAMAPGATGVLVLAVGAPAWSFFGFFSLGLCTHRAEMGQLGTLVIEDQLAGAVPGPVDSGAARIFQLCGMQAEQPATGAQVATTCSHRRFPAHRVDCGEVENFPALRNGGERTGDVMTGGNSLRHKGFPPIGQAMTGSRFFGFAERRLAAWRCGDGRRDSSSRWTNGRRRMASHPAQGADGAGRAKKRAGPAALLGWIRWG